ncbi:MAG: hypothetical protein OEY07_07365 [Gammaproteobacteria bacterium]|nr:hypothetical protein [Gammaproteobacteria bacterium]
MTKLWNRILCITVSLFISGSCPAVDPNAPESKQAMQYFESLMTRVNQLATMRAATDKRGLHALFCKASKGNIKADDLHNNLTRSDSMHTLRGIEAPWPLQVLAYNNARDVFAFHKLETVSVSLTIGTWFEIGGRKVKNSVGEIWRFRHADNQWCIVFGS